MTKLLAGRDLSYRHGHLSPSASSLFRLLCSEIDETLNLWISLSDAKPVSIIDLATSI